MRTSGTIVGISATGLTVWAAAASGWAGLGIVPALTGWMALAAAASLRMYVEAGPDGLVIHNGLWRRRYEWSRVQGFRAVDRVGQAGIYVLVDEDGLVRLPFENLSPWPKGKGRRRRVAEQLRECARRFRTEPKPRAQRTRGDDVGPVDGPPSHP